MDYDNDTKVSQEDIQKFCQEHYLDLSPQIIQEIFEDGCKNRADLTRNPKDKYLKGLTT